ncbi:hypothetical protein O3P69_001387 [Scylla paramamosain]|uniref:Uncharacterized protein n=1 Tax=Scylla paramamosain TaxID=85552 RepID=A0AAW0USR5_SCYPA
MSFVSILKAPPEASWCGRRDRDVSHCLAEGPAAPGWNCPVIQSITGRREVHGRGKTRANWSGSVRSLVKIAGSTEGFPRSSVQRDQPALTQAGDQYYVGVNTSGPVGEGGNAGLVGAGGRGDAGAAVRVVAEVECQTGWPQWRPWRCGGGWCRRVTVTLPPPPPPPSSSFLLPLLLSLSLLPLAGVVIQLAAGPGGARRGGAGRGGSRGIVAQLNPTGVECALREGAVPPGKSRRTSWMTRGPPPPTHARGHARTHAHTNPPPRDGAEKKAATSGEKVMTKTTI